MSQPPLSQDYLQAIEEARTAMDGFIESIRAYNSHLTPSLYGPYSQGYSTWVTDGQDYVHLDVVNDGTRHAPWVPVEGGALGSAWRHEVRNWADPDDVTVHHVEPYDLEEVLQLRQIVESESPTLEGLVLALTSEDLDAIRDGMRTLQESMIALNAVAPAAADGADHCESVDEYIDNNWTSDSARTFRQGVADMQNAFSDLEVAVNDMLDGNEALFLAFMSFVTAIMEVLDIRQEEAEEAFSNVVNGGVSLLGVALAPADALAWVGLALFVVDVAGADDSQDRRDAMDDFQNHAISRAIAKAKDNTTVEWPSFDNPTVDFA